MVLTRFFDRASVFSEPEFTALETVESSHNDFCCHTVIVIVFANRDRFSYLAMCDLAFNFQHYRFRHQTSTPDFNHVIENKECAQYRQEQDQADNKDAEYVAAEQHLQHRGGLVSRRDLDSTATFGRLGRSSSRWFGIGSLCQDDLIGGEISDQ